MQLVASVLRTEKTRYDPHGLRNLAVAILKSAILEEDEEFPTVDVWCAVLDLNSEAFNWRLRRALSNSHDNGRSVNGVVPTSVTTKLDPVLS